MKVLIEKTVLNQNDYATFISIVLENVYMEKLVRVLESYSASGSGRVQGRDIDEVITSLGFVDNKVDHCVYLKNSGSKLIFLVLYVDDILLSSNDLDLLNKTKGLLSKNFDMKDLGEASFVLGIEILRDRSQNLLGLSQRAYVDRVLKRFNMENCKVGEVLVVKGDKLCKSQCPNNNFERKSMENVSYASTVGVTPQIIP